MNLIVKSNYSSKKLFEIIEINPKLDKKPYRDSEEVTFVPMAAVTELINKIDISNKRKFVEVQKGYTSFCESDVIFAKVTPCMENGKVALVPKLTTNIGFGSTEFHVLRAGKSILPKFLYYFVSSEGFRREAARAMTGAVGLRRVPSTFLKQNEIPLPPITYQEKIVGKIDKLFSKIDSGVEDLRRVQKNLELYKQSILNAAIRGKLVSQDPNDEPASKLLQRIRAEKDKLIKEGKLKKEKALSPIKCDEVPFELVDGWQWIKLQSIIITGPSNGYSPKGVAYETKTKVLTLSATTFGYYEPSYFKYFDKNVALEKNLWVNVGDILIQRGNTIDYVGISAIVNSSEPRLYPDLMIRIRVSEQVNKEYIWLVLNAPFSRKYVQKNTTGAQSTMPKISQPVVSNWPIPLPPKRIQDEIVNKWKEQNLLVVKVNSLLKKMMIDNNLLKQSILKSAFEGSLL